MQLQDWQQNKIQFWYELISGFSEVRNNILLKIDF